MMSDSYHLKIKKGGAAVASLSELDRVLAAGDGDAALLYLYLLRREGDGAGAAEALGFSSGRMTAAARVLSRAGVLEQGEGAFSAAAPAPPAVLRERRENSPEVDALCRAYERAAGRPLRREELSALADAHARLGLPTPVLLTLIHSLPTQGKPLSAASFEREACLWADRRIDTLEKAEAHLRHAALQGEALRQTVRLLHLDGRPLSPTERRYLVGWLELGFSPEAIERAYDKTVVNTGALKWRYMDKILQSWHQAGLHTTDEVAREGAPAKKAEKPSAKAPAEKMLGGMPAKEYARMVEEYLKKEGESGHGL